MSVGHCKTKSSREACEAQCSDTPPLWGVDVHCNKNLNLKELAVNDLNEAQASIEQYDDLKVVVLCRNSEGVPTFHTCAVDVSKTQYANGEHYDLGPEQKKTRSTTALNRSWRLISMTRPASSFWILGRGFALSLDGLFEKIGIELGTFYRRGTRCSRVCLQWVWVDLD